MESLLAAVPVATIILVLVVCIPAMIKFVGWILKLVKAHKNIQQTSFEEGRQAERADEQERERFEAGEARIECLEEREDKLEKILLNQQQQIKSLIDSDQLNIKYSIKRTYEKVRLTGSIDSQDLDLLEQRFAIYKARGGNSWAEGLMNQIRQVAHTTPAPLGKDHKDNQDN